MRQPLGATVIRQVHSRLASIWNNPLWLESSMPAHINQSTDRPLRELETPANSSRGIARRALSATLGHARFVRLLKEIALLGRLHASIPLVLTQTQISFPSTSPDGFAISIEAVGGRYVVQLGFWRGEFDSVACATELIDASLRGEIRIKIEGGNRSSRCTLERRNERGEWIPGVAQDSSSLKMRGPTSVIYLRNGVWERLSAANFHSGVCWRGIRARARC
jgi:hypothetical protein